MGRKEQHRPEVVLIVPELQFHSPKPMSYAENGRVASLTAELMTWFQLQYVGNRKHPETLVLEPKMSPLLAQPRLMSKLCPNILVLASGCPLRDEGLLYTKTSSSGGRL